MTKAIRVSFPTATMRCSTLSGVRLAGTEHVDWEIVELDER
jgi:hypothetical protein